MIRWTGRAALAATALLAIAGAAPAPGATYRNPVLYADYSDPDVIRVGKSYYLVASTFHYSPGLPVLKSPDLVHWAIVGHVLPRLPFAPEYDLPGPVPQDDAGSRVPRERQAENQRYGRGVWAPAIRQHGGRTYVYFATPDEGIFMSSAPHPEGPWSPPVVVLPGPGYEDPCPFWDEDGTAWLVHSKVGAGPLVLHRMSRDGMRVLDGGVTIVEDRVALPTLEGPKLYKRAGWYYIFAPIGGVATGPQAVLRAKRLQGPWEHRVVLEKGATEVQAPHQGGWVETPSGQGWFVHFNSTGGYGRIVHLQPLSWSADGWPLIGEPLPGRTSGQPVAEHTAPDVGGRFPPVRPQTSDEFAAPTLGVQWEWNHNPVDTRWSLAARHGFLRLISAPARDLVSARNTLTQVQPGRSYAVTTRLETGSLAEGQRAGLAMFGQGVSWIGVVRQSGRIRLLTSLAGAESLATWADGASVQLRMTVDDETARYAYSLDEGRSFHDLGAPAPFRFSWWKGARPALFSYSAPGAAVGGAADFDWARFSNIQP